PAGWVSAEFFDVLGAHPLAGRLFLPGDDDDDRPVVVLSEGLWKARFGASPSAIGATLRLSGRPFSVVGVLPGAMTFPEDARLWIPLTLTPKLRALRGIHDFLVLARLKPGVGLAA